MRRVLLAERRIRSARPPAAAPDKPDGADGVLIALAARHAPGDRVGIRDVCAAAGICERIAGEVRQWARGAGLWPYLPGRPRAAGWSGRPGADGEGGEP